MSANGINAMEGASAVACGWVFVETGGSARVMHHEGEREKAPHEGEQTVVTLVKARHRLFVGFAEIITHVGMRVLLMATTHAGSWHEGQFWTEAGQHFGAQLNVWVRLVLTQRSKVFLDVSSHGQIAGKRVNEAEHKRVLGCGFGGQASVGFSQRWCGQGAYDTETRASNTATEAT